VNVFDAPLAQCGYWIDRPGYGRCWYPAYVSSDWRPYCEGYWMWTDQGWYWASDEQWAWATYHYGRWVQDPYYGWLWVPGTEWAPSWVSWRESDDYVGWAPLPPDDSFGPSGYVVVNDPPPSTYVFVGVGIFSQPVHRSTVIVNNTTIINKTVNITKITRVNNVVVNNGPQVNQFQRINTRNFTEPPPHATANPYRTNQPRPDVVRTPASAPQQTWQPPVARGDRYSHNQTADPQPQPQPRFGQPQSRPAQPQEQFSHQQQPLPQQRDAHDDSRRDQRQAEKDNKKNQQYGG